MQRNELPKKQEKKRHENETKRILVHMRTTDDSFEDAHSNDAVDFRPNFNFIIINSEIESSTARSLRSTGYNENAHILCTK